MPDVANLPKRQVLLIADSIMQARAACDNIVISRKLVLRLVRLARMDNAIADALGDDECCPHCGEPIIEQDDDEDE